MGENYLIDTNIIITYLDSKLPEKGMKFIDSIVDSVPKLSIISKIEVLGFSFKNTSSHLIINDFINNSSLINLTDDIVEQTILIRRTCRIKLPDAIIAATALTRNYILLTNDINDFKNIPGLNIINPWDLKD